MTSLRQIAVYGVLGVIFTAAVFCWLTEDGTETHEAEQDETGRPARTEKTERSVVVGESSLTAMVRVDRTGAEQESHLVSVEERLQTLDKSKATRAVPASAERTDTAAVAAAPAPQTETVDHDRKNRQTESVRNELPKKDKPLPVRKDFEENFSRRTAGRDAPAFVPHEPAELPSERTKWHPMLKDLGVNSWSYRVVRISKHAYRVNATFVFADGRSFVYSTMSQNGYPAAPALVREWLAKNPPEEA